ncbi:MAG TPA: aldo/keto reductase [Thermoleophilaceae bacterium]|nr:aldo/keto reductase [Thermoleophilaceae bacterium]
MPANHAGAQIGLGLAALGRPGYINLGHGHDVKDIAVERMERAAHEVLDAAYDAGVRAFDAARSYGRAEAFLASWLARRGLAPGDAEVSSKWGYTYTADWRVDADEHEVKELTAAQLRRQWRETEQLLDGHVRLYQIHSATVDSGVLDDGEVRAELAALRARGVRIGLTVTGARQAATIERALAVGGFDAVQATWNLHERSAEAALERAHEAGLLVMVKEAVANGRLTARGANPVLGAAARALGTTEDALALAAALARPWADLILSGAATVDQLRSNLAARELVWDEELERRLAGLVEDPDGYWAARARLPWN